MPADQQETLPPPIWIHTSATVTDPKVTDMHYAAGTTIKTQGWPSDYLQSLWMTGKAHQVDPPATVYELYVEVGG